MRVLWVHRKQRVYGNFSIENSFSTIKGFVSNKVSLTEWSAPFYSNGLLPRLRSVLSLRSETADVYHITGDIYFINLGLFGRKNIVTFHDIGFLNHSNPILRWILLLFWVKFPARRATLVTCVSEATRQEVLKFSGIKPEKARVVPTVVNLNWSRMDKVFNSEQPRILQIGTKHNKNLKSLIPALKDLPVVLTIVGVLDKTTQDVLKENNITYENHHNISFDELHELYNQADVVTFVSTLEGFGMPIIEANIVGRVVVTSNLSSMPEIAGDSAILVDPYSISSIREGIVSAINDSSLRNSLIEKGFKNSSRFSASTVADQYLNLYEEILL